MMGGFFLAIIKNNLVKTLCYILDKCLFGNNYDFETLDFKSFRSMCMFSCLVFSKSNGLSA